MPGDAVGQRRGGQRVLPADRESRPGTYSFSASYPGDSNFTASQTSAPTTVTVGHATSATSITPSTASAVAGQPVTETVKVER